MSGAWDEGTLTKTIHFSRQLRLPQWGGWVCRGRCSKRRTWRVSVHEIAPEAAGFLPPPVGHGLSSPLGVGARGELSSWGGMIKVTSPELLRRGHDHVHLEKFTLWLLLKERHTGRDKLFFHWILFCLDVINGIVAATLQPWVSYSEKNSVERWENIGSLMTYLNFQSWSQQLKCMKYTSSSVNHTKNLLSLEWPSFQTTLQAWIQLTRGWVSALWQV